MSGKGAVHGHEPHPLDLALRKKETIERIARLRFRIEFCQYVMAIYVEEV